MKAHATEILDVKPVLDRRRTGVLLHPTSLPSGRFGADAVRFLDFLVAGGCSVWQMLPLGPTHADLSPYHCRSVHAINPDLIDRAALVAAGWLTEAEAAAPTALARAADNFFVRAPAAEQDAFREFCVAAGWLEDYALFEVLRARFGECAWWEWPAPLRDRDPAALAMERAARQEEIDHVRFQQFVAALQWRALREEARTRGIWLFGDMPIFVARDSAEVWARHEFFKLAADGEPQVVAGVPPDYFSATGQRWGNPLYDWKRMQQSGFAWWIERMQTELSRFDLVRIDHFRGFEACWEIPASDATAVNGHWEKVPGVALFDTLLARFGSLPLVAEDLGFITKEVHALRERYGLPGMLVLQFAFEGGPTNPYLPHNHRRDAVVYTGTHDNDTTRGWFEDLAAPQQLRVVDYFGYQQEPMPWPLIRAALASVAELAIVPMQDVLGLGRGHRMNTPGVAQGNWQWRFRWEDLSAATVETLRRLNHLYGRTGSGD